MGYDKYLKLYNKGRKWAKKKAKSFSSEELILTHNKLKSILPSTSKNKAVHSELEGRIDELSYIARDRGLTGLTDAKGDL